MAAAGSGREGRALPRLVACDLTIIWSRLELVLQACPLQDPGFSHRSSGYNVNLCDFDILRKIVIDLLNGFVAVRSKIEAAPVNLSERSRKLRVPRLSFRAEKNVFTLFS